LSKQSRNKKYIQITKTGINYFLLLKINILIENSIKNKKINNIYDINTMAKLGYKIENSKLFLIWVNIYTFFLCNK